MRKSLWRILALVMVGMLSLCLTSCGSDDDDDVVEVNSPIVGEWQTTPYIKNANGYVEFKSNGKYRLTLTTSDGASTYKGNYESTDGSDGIIKLFDSDGDPMDFWEYTISSDGQTMTTESVTTSSHAKLTWRKL